MLNIIAFIILKMDSFINLMKLYDFEPFITILVGCIIKDNGNILLVHQKESGKYGLPKGHLEIGETIPACAKREIWEELGIHVEINDEPISTKYFNNEFYSFIVDKYNGTIDVSGSKGEITKAIWVSCNEIIKYNLNLYSRCILEKYFAQKYVTQNNPWFTFREVRKNNYMCDKNNIRNIHKTCISYTESCEITTYKRYNHNIWNKYNTCDSKMYKSHTDNVVSCEIVSRRRYITSTPTRSDIDKNWRKKDN